MIGTYSRDSVTWLQGAALNSYGDPSAPPAEKAVNARIDWKSRRITNAGGEEVISAGMVRMAEAPNPGRDKIRVDGVEHIILAVRTVRSFSRVSHHEVYIQ